MASSLESPPANGGGNSKNGETERLRIRKAFWLSVIGLGLAAALVVVLAFAGYGEASEITSIVGLFTSVLGTLAGAFFGLQVGSSGKEKAENRADEAQKKLELAGKRLEVVLSLANPSVLSDAKRAAPNLFE